MSQKRPAYTRTPSALNTNPNPKRIIQEIIRSDSPVTSIGETGTYSGLYNMPSSDTQSQEPSCSEASSSKPLPGQAKLYKSPRG
ncbi:1654_t:CDS:1, partial [Acaulospora colombiana]